ncbi:MAG: exonuclease SbcCD subunit D [Nitrososphaeria archaeon]|nr:exonuclease SbcCD subunit D [Nitrososphaeria archaeon]
MVKILHTADLHIGEDIFSQYSMKAATERFNDILYSLDQIKDIAIQNEVDAVIIAGDVFNRIIPSGNSSYYFSKFLKQLLENRIHTIIVRGNHDRPYTEDSSELLKTYNILLSSKQEEYFHYLSRIENIVINSKNGKKISFTALPYYPSDLEFKEVQDIKEAFEKSRIEKRQDFIRSLKEESLKKVNELKNSVQADYHILIAHVPIMGAIPGSERVFLGSKYEIVYEVNEICRLPFDYIALGHFHVMQQIGSEKCWYSGSIFRLTFDESSYIDGREVSRSDKGVIFVSDDNGKLVPKPITIKTRDLCVVHLNYSNPKIMPLPQNLGEVVENISAKCLIKDKSLPPCVKVFIKISDIQRKMLNEYKIREMLLEKGYLDIKFEIITEQTEQISLKTTNMPVEEALKRYIESLQIDSQLKKQVLKESLKILKEVM